MRPLSEGIAPESEKNWGDGNDFREIGAKKEGIRKEGNTAAKERRKVWYAEGRHRIIGGRTTRKDFKGQKQTSQTFGKERIMWPERELEEPAKKSPEEERLTKETTHLGRGKGVRLTILMRPGAEGIVLGRAVRAGNPAKKSKAFPETTKPLMGDKTEKHPLEQNRGGNHVPKWADAGKNRGGTPRYPDLRRSGGKEREGPAQRLK